MLKFQYFGHPMRRTDSLEKTFMLGKIEGSREGDNRGCNGWMASPTQWTWVWASAGSWWWTRKPGVLQSRGSQSRTRLSNWTDRICLRSRYLQSSKAIIQSMSGVSDSKVCHLFKKLCHIPSSLPHLVSTTGPTEFSTRKLSLSCFQIYTSLRYAIHLWFRLSHTFKILGTLII